MTTFLRLLADKDKATNLLASCRAFRSAESDTRVLQVAPESFRAVPGAPFAYWVSGKVLSLYESAPAFESDTRTVRVGLQTSDDFRFIRLRWEVSGFRHKWFPFAKGGNYSPFYTEFYVSVNWHNDGHEMKAWAESLYGGGQHWSRRLQNVEYNFRPGLTFPRRAHRLAANILPEGSIISVRGSGVFADKADLLAIGGLFSSSSFDFLVKCMLGRFGYPEFISGTLCRAPMPFGFDAKAEILAAEFGKGVSISRMLNSINELSSAFTLPAVLRSRLSNYDPPAFEAELMRIQNKIDAIAFDLYGFGESDRAAVQASQGVTDEGDTESSTEDEGDDEGSTAPIDQTAGLLSWAVGVAFGRFDWRLATGERVASPEPEPFEPLPAKSPGMLPDGDAPFHAHSGILVDDPGHAHDLVRIAERVLERVDMPVPAELRRWLQKDFFPFHLQRYSKCRRKAPIYWPLATTSGSYTLWLYYPSLTSQTLYTAINDFVEPKLAEVESEAATLRTKGSARSRDEEKRLEALATLETELRDLRDQLLVIAPQYKPNHDDGVQISAAPLWPLFRHKPWQKVLKDSWAKLEKGDYDWAQLAMKYWPERVREKCKHDKSLAIAHGLEELYVEPPATPKKARGRKTAGAEE